MIQIIGCNENVQDYVLLLMLLIVQYKNSIMVNVLPYQARNPGLSPGI